MGRWEGEDTNERVEKDIGGKQGVRRYGGVKMTNEQ